MKALFGSSEDAHRAGYYSRRHRNGDAHREARARYGNEHGQGVKRAEANARAGAGDSAMSIEEQLAKLDRFGRVAKRERARLQARLDARLETAKREAAAAERSARALELMTAQRAREILTEAGVSA